MNKTACCWNTHPVPRQTFNKIHLLHAISPKELRSAVFVYVNVNHVSNFLSVNTDIDLVK